ncbi:MAG: hypothetical protein PHC64_06675 [Candidatus Gastranaerophilales bacterium]|nr:hypothetical protein [Candidatus Gastranaerophilales bacterium]
MKKLIKAQDLIEELKNTDIESYNEIKENTAKVKETFKHGGYRQNAGRKRIKDISLSFTIRVDAIEKEFIIFARENKIDLNKFITEKS